MNRCYDGYDYFYITIAHTYAINAEDEEDGILMSPDRRRSSILAGLLGFLVFDIIMYEIVIEQVESMS